MVDTRDVGNSKEILVIGDEFVAASKGLLILKLSVAVQTFLSQIFSCCLSSRRRCSFSRWSLSCSPLRHLASDRSSAASRKLWRYSASCGVLLGRGSCSCLLYLIIFRGSADGVSIVYNGYQYTFVTENDAV